MTKNQKNKPNEGPKTRAQLKKTEEINRKTNKDENGDDKKKTRETVKKKGWTSLEDVEAKLKALEKQYSHAKDEKNKKRYKNS